MRTDRLPIRFNPFHLAEKDMRLEGSIALKSMDRLKQTSVTPLEPDAQVMLRFSTEMSGIVLLTGKIRARLSMTCQRCLHDMVLDIDWPIELALIHSDAEAVEVQDGFETYEVIEDTIFTRDLIEDELLLSLPIVPMHEDPVHCDDSMLTFLRPQLEQEVSATDHNPFKVLKDLGKNRH